MIIDCTLKRSNPPEVKFTWYSCNTPTCGEKSQSLTKKSILQLDSQPKSVMKYKCKAKNAAGAAVHLKSLRCLSPQKTSVSLPNRNYILICLQSSRQSHRYEQKYIFHNPVQTMNELLRSWEDLYGSVCTSQPEIAQAKNLASCAQ